MTEVACERQKLRKTLNSTIPACAAVCLLALAVVAGWPHPLTGDGHSRHIIDHAHPGAPPMTPTVAKGTFDVSLTPQPAGDGLARMRMEKRFHGDLDATGEGEMLSWQDEEAGAAAYVAVERVTGSLHGRTGSFTLTHRGTMTADDQRLAVEVVPGSGTSELAGIEGTMAIEITGGEHIYQLEYDLSEDTLDPNNP